MRQVLDRGGVLEIAVTQMGDEEEGDLHLVWRVRLLEITESEIVVEQPSTLGSEVPIEQGIELLAVLAIGQNRWMFTTTNLGTDDMLGPDRRPVRALRLLMPESVQRCQRRNYYRVEVSPLSLPQAELWPLLDPRSVIPAERANEIQWEIQTGQVPCPTEVTVPFDHDAIMPEVGPKIQATMLNIGGGGMGMRIGPEDASVLNRHKIFWMRVALPKGVPTPICATGKLVHTHMESNHDIYAGMSFDFTFNPAHQKFVVDQICRYIAMQQRMQLQNAPERQRRSA